MILKSQYQVACHSTTRTLCGRVAALFVALGHVRGGHILTHYGAFLTPDAAGARRLGPGGTVRRGFSAYFIASLPVRRTSQHDLEDRAGSPK